MEERNRVARWGAALRRGLRPRSLAAFGFAILCVAAATLARMAIDLIAPNAVPFATYFPAILLATLAGGWLAGAFATLISATVSWYMFVPPRYQWVSPTSDDLVSLTLFVLAALAVMWVAEQYRRMIRRLDEEEHYRQVVVDELGHRVKNKLATIYAILHHELRDQKDIWDSVSGRLRALSAADDFLVKSDGNGVDLKQILTLELTPYDLGRISMRGEPVQLRDKLAVVLALIVHELSTNAAKYGALSLPAGRVDISWRADGDHIALDWVESGGPAVTRPKQRSFGSKLIERSLDAFDGAATILYVPTGVVCRMRFIKPTAPGETQDADSAVT